MPIEISQILPELHRLAQEYPVLAQTRASLLKALREQLQKLPELEAQLAQRLPQVEQEVPHWRGAFRSDSLAVNEHQLPADLPARYDLLAADGSQIYPNRHNALLYYLINIGSIYFQHGSGCTPQLRTVSQLFASPQDLFNENDRLVDTPQVNAIRDVAEIGMLAERASEVAHDSAVPLLALLDNALQLYVADERALPARKLQEWRKQFQASMATLQARGAILAGVIDRPRAQNVLRLLRLADAILINDEALKLPHEWLGLTDGLLFENLPPRARSCIFCVPFTGRDALPPAHFFYLNLSSHQVPNIVRVEIPEYVANAPQAVDTLHSVLLHQSDITGQYPYVLSRAHQLAVVSQSEKYTLDAIMLGELAKNGVMSQPSFKQQGKQL